MPIPANMNRLGVLATAGSAVAIGLAPVVPLLMAHNTAAFDVPNVHFYAVSTTAILCAALAIVLGVVGIRRHDRRSAAVGAGFTVMAALLAVHGLTTPGFLIEDGYYAAVGVSGALAVPLGGAVILATLLSRPRSRGHVRDLVYLQAGVVVAAVAFGLLALLDPGAIPSVPVALRPLVWWIVGVNALVYGVLALRALRTFQLTRRVGDLAVVAGLTWLAIAVATYLLSPTWSVGFWAGHLLELGAFVVIFGALASDLARATPSRTLSEVDVHNVVTEEEGLLGAWVARLLARLAVKDTSTREHTRRVAQLAVQVGQELGLRGKRLRGLAVAALLHDVGKLQVPESILRKAAPLTPAEFEVIKRHPGRRRRTARPHRRLQRGAAARARAPRAVGRERISGRPARERAFARGPHSRSLRRLRRAHERARLPPRLLAGAGAHDPGPGPRDRVRPGRARRALARRRRGARRAAPARGLTAS